MAEKTGFRTQNRAILCYHGYPCSGMSDNMGLECTDGGTLTHIVTTEDGTETRTVVYSDGTAFFRQKGGRLFWSDGKENKGMEIGFEKIG